MTPKQTYQIISDNPEVQAFYMQMREAGESHSIAEMLALQQTPFLMTDSVFLTGMSVNGSQFEKTPHIGDYYKAEAEAAGVDITGKVYLSGLAFNGPGDPKAWISGRADIQRVCDEANAFCLGSVNVKARQPEREPPPPPRLAASIVKRRMREEIAKNPEAARDKELAEKIIDKHGAKR